MQDFAPFATLVGLALLLWLILVRPQQRRQRELAHMQSTLDVGDDVMLTSGVFGTVRGLDDDVAQVEIADGVTIRVARGAIGQVVRDDVPTTDDTAHTNSGEAPEVSEEN